MKILIVFNSQADSKSFSGALRHFVQMADEWVKMGHVVDFLCPKCIFPKILAFSPGSGCLSSDSIFDAASYVSHPSLFIPLYLWRLATPYFTRITKKYDVVLASSQLPFEMIPTMVMQRRIGCKMALKIHHVVSAQRAAQGIFDRMFMYFERRACFWVRDRASLLVCGTELIAADFNKLQKAQGVEPTTARISGYGTTMPEKIFRPESEREYDAVFLGRLHPVKGAADLPSIWQKIRAGKPGARLLVIGEGTLRAKLTSQFAELGMSDAVEFTGGIDEARKNELLSRSRVGLSLSFEEGWGLSVQEFLAAGLPVVAYRLPVFEEAFPDVLNQVTKGDSNEFSEVLSKLLADENERERQGIRGRKFVERYSVNGVAKREMGFLEEMLAG